MKEKKNWNHNWLFTRFANKGRYAGAGVTYDDYSEESGNRHYYKSGYPRFATDGCKPEELNGPVIVVQEGRKKDGK